MSCFFACQPVVTVDGGSVALPLFHGVEGSVVVGGARCADKGKAVAQFGAFRRYVDAGFPVAHFEASLSVVQVGDIRQVSSHFGDVDRVGGEALLHVNLVDGIVVVDGVEVRAVIGHVSDAVHATVDDEAAEVGAVEGIAVDCPAGVVDGRIDIGSVRSHSVLVGDGPLDVVDVFRIAFLVGCLVGGQVDGETAALTQGIVPVQSDQVVSFHLGT